MKRYLNLIFIVLAWLFSIVNTSGLGLVYKTPEKTNYIIIIWFLFVLLKSKQKITIGGKYTFLSFLTILSFIIIPFISANSWDGFTYLLMIPLVYCFSQQKISQFDIYSSGYIVAGLGICTLYVYSKTDILAGWNDNQIGMIGLFSYLYYAISLFGKISFRKMSIGVTISIIYMILLTQNTESRSIAIFIIIALIMAYFGEITRKITDKKRFVFIALSVPLLVAVAIVLFPQLEIFQAFNKWSEQNYGKSAFNGRDELWMYTFQNLSKNYYLGDGKFLINHHNSAIAALGVFGVIGYICWYKLLAIPVRKMTYYIYDDIVFGCLMAFLLIFWQQSFDLGFISASPNMLPYVILGVGLGRVKTISIYAKNKYNNTRI